MSKLLEEAISRLRTLPDTMQELAARQLIRQLEEEPEPGDLKAIDEGRQEANNGNSVTLDQWRHDMGLSNH